MNTLIFDTNFVIALLDTADYNHRRAMNSLKKYDLGGTKFVVPVIVFVEVLAGLKEVEILHDLIEGLKIDIEFISKRDIELIEKIEYKTRKKLKANDSLIYAMSKRIGAKILTYDKKLQLLTKKSKL